MFNKKYLVIKKGIGADDDFRDLVMAEFAELSEAYGYRMKQEVTCYIAKIIEPKVTE